LVNEIQKQYHRKLNPEMGKGMILNIQQKGKKLLIKETELHAYMDTKILEITRFVSSVTLALVVITILTIINIFKGGDIFLYLLIALPLIGRRYVNDTISKWLRKKFEELIGI
jgi:hypothetical protein